MQLSSHKTLFLHELFLSFDGKTSTHCVFFKQSEWEIAPTHIMEDIGRIQKSAVVVYSKK